MYVEFSRKEDQDLQTGGRLHLINIYDPFLLSKFPIDSHLPLYMKYLKT